MHLLSMNNILNENTLYSGGRLLLYFISKIF